MSNTEEDSQELELGMSLAWGFLGLGTELEEDLLADLQASSRDFGKSEERARLTFLIREMIRPRNLLRSILSTYNDENPAEVTEDSLVAFHRNTDGLIENIFAKQMEAIKLSEGLRS